LATNLRTLHSHPPAGPFENQRAQRHHGDQVESIAMVYAELGVSEAARRLLGGAERMVGAGEGSLRLPGAARGPLTG